MRALPSVRGRLDLARRERAQLLQRHHEAFANRRKIRSLEKDTDAAMPARGK